MKVSIAISILILLVAALLGFQGHQKLTAAREDHATLTTSANELGISIDPSHADAPTRITKRPREDKPWAAKAIAQELISFAREMETIEKNGNPPDESQQQRIMEMMGNVMDLDSTQLKLLIAELRTATDINQEARQGLIGFSIMTLANNHPQAAIKLLTEPSNLLENHQFGHHLISSSLAKWATDDPLSAVDWLRKNRAKFPDLINDDAKSGLISGTATKDPALAFSLLAELAFEDESDAVSSIARAANTPEEQTATLTALRRHLATVKDDATRENLSNKVLREFAQPMSQGNFDTAKQWLTAANLTPSEAESFASGLHTNSIKNGETGRWIEWIGEQLPADQAARKIQSHVSTWTQNDYQATANWLSSVPDGPTKHTAIRTYAETVSRYEPETAAQWALTLPPGKNRDETLKNIHQIWPEDDPAKHAFAKDNGIE